MIVLLMRRHDSEEAICLYTLIYIDTKELVSRREEIVLQSEHNQLICSKEYTREVYTWT
jgi:cephalosporin-C deacetylase-like acetyl esterase